MLSHAEQCQAFDDENFLTQEKAYPSVPGLVLPVLCYRQHHLYKFKKIKNKNNIYIYVDIYIYFHEIVHQIDTCESV